MENGLESRCLFLCTRPPLGALGTQLHLCHACDSGIHDYMLKMMLFSAIKCDFDFLFAFCWIKLRLEFRTQLTLP